MHLSKPPLQLACFLLSLLCELDYSLLIMLCKNWVHASRFKERTVVYLKIN